MLKMYPTFAKSRREHCKVSLLSLVPSPSQLFNVPCRKGGAGDEAITPCLCMLGTVLSTLMTHLYVYYANTGPCTDSVIIRSWQAMMSLIQKFQHSSSTHIAQTSACREYATNHFVCKERREIQQ